MGIGLRALALNLFITAAVFGAQSVSAAPPEAVPASVSRAELQNRSLQTCVATTTSEPPFYASVNEAAQKNYAKMVRSKARPEVAGYIPKNSVVKLLNGQKLSTGSVQPTDFVDVQVLSVPNAATDDHAKSSPPEIRNAVIGPAARAQAGFRGAIAAQFLKRAGDVSYIVQRDAPALSIPGGEYSIAGKPIRLAKTPTGIFGRPGGYRVNRCCNAQTLKSDSIIGSMVNAVSDNITAYRIGHAESPPEGCRDNYVFEIMSPQLTCIEKTIELAGPTCDRFVSNLRPVANDQLESVFALSRLTGRGPESSEFIDSEGLYKLPKDPRTEQRPFGGLNAWRNPVSERSPANNSDLNYDSFMDPMAACAYMRVLQAWQKTCNQPGCQIQDNDAYHPPSWRGHQSHGKKTCLDIFPLSKSARGPGSITFSSPNYDRERTMKLIETLINAGAERSQLGFSDPVAVKRFGTKPWAGHQNHIHVCFPTSPEAAESARVRKTCLDGVSPSGAPAAKTLVTPKTTFEEATARAAGAIGYFNFLSPQCQ